MTFPLCTLADLYEMLTEVQQQLDEMDSVDVVHAERFENLRETRLEHKRQIVAEIEARGGKQAA